MDSEDHIIFVNMPDHCDQQLLECQYCPKTFTQKSYLDMHQWSHDINQSYQCKICKESFARKAKFHTHVRSCKEEHDAVGSEGEQSDGTEEDISCKKKEPLNSAEGPSKSSITADNKMKLRSTKHAAKSAINADAKKSDPKRIRLRKTDDGERPFQCEVCHKRFKSRHHLADHITIHSEKKMFRCDICEREFACKWYLKKHVKNVHTEKWITEHTKNTSGRKVHTRSKRKISNKVYESKKNSERRVIKHDAKKQLDKVKTEGANSTEDTRIRGNDMERSHDTQETDISCDTNQPGRTNKGSCITEESDIGCEQDQPDSTEGTSDRCMSADDKIVLSSIKHDANSMVNTFAKKSDQKSIRLQRGDDGERPFQCEVCHKRFKKRHHLVDHVTIHSEKKLFECEFCAREFSCKWYLKKHIKNRHSKNTLQRADCTKNASGDTKRKSLERHDADKSLESKKTKGVFVCPRCQDEFSSKELMERHYKTHAIFCDEQIQIHHLQDARPKKYHCDTCQKDFTCQQDLNRHTEHDRRHHRKKQQMKQESDSDASGDEMNIDDHCRKMQEQELECDSDGSEDGKDVLDDEDSIHAEQEMFRCEICQKEFVCQKFLTDHIENLHRKNKCKEKDVDMKDHSGKDKMNVDAQGDSENIIESEKSDMTRSNSDRSSKYRFHCSTCQKDFACKRNLTRHIEQDKKHQSYIKGDFELEEKIFRCEICQKDFACKRYLNKHISHMHKKNKHEEKDVDMTSSNSDRSSESRFHCPTCQKDFTCQRNLTLHIERDRIHHSYSKGDSMQPEHKMFQCEICQKDFVCQRYLTKHIGLMHRKNMHEEKDVDMNDYLGKNKMNVEGDEPSENIIESKNSDRTSSNSYRSSKSRFYCSICQEFFASKRNLTRHNDRKHHSYSNVEQKIFQCEICQKDFACKSNLTDHIRLMHRKNMRVEKDVDMKDRSGNETSTHGEKVSSKLACTECPKQFSTKNLLKEHLESHIVCKNSDLTSTPDCSSKSRLYCSICQQFFASKRNLTRHNDRKHHNQHDEKDVDSKDHSGNDGIDHKQKKGFKCELCNKSFPRKCLLKYHRLHHTEEKTHQCELCGNNFKRRANLTEHMFKCHDVHDKPFQCEFCQRKFVRLSFLTRHVKIMHRKDYQCELCGKCFNENRHLKYHISRTHHKLKPFKCKTCKVSYATKAPLIRHNVLIHDRKATYRCCGKVFLLKQFLKAHLVTHNKKRLLRCRICRKKFLSKYTLRAHIKVHTKDKSFRCKYCRRCFAQKSQLRHHMMLHAAGTRNNLFGCEHCPKKFVTRACLLSHTSWNHIKRKLYACKYCKKSFTSSNLLKAHITSVHREEHLAHSINYRRKLTLSYKLRNLYQECDIRTNCSISMPHICQYCNKRFRFITDKNYHVRTHHTREKPFPCELCHWRFTRKGDLRVHMLRAHTKSTPVGCTKCSKRFPHSFALKRHTNLYHSGNPYVHCDLCPGKSFPNEVYLRKHMETHHSNKVFPCDICGSCFKFRGTMREHMRRHRMQYKCNVCHLHFKVQSELKDHMVEHTTALHPFQCDICFRCYTSHRSLQQHKSKNHNKKTGKDETLNDQGHSGESVSEHKDAVLQLEFIFHADQII